MSDADTINALIAAVIAIETELGIVPAGVYADVRTRLDILEARINNPFAPAPDVLNPFFIGNTGVTIQAGFGDPNAVLAIPPPRPGSLFLREDGYVSQGLYSFRGDGFWHEIDTGETSPWTAGGDLSGTNTFQVVIGLQRNPISTATPITGNTLGWNGTNWTPSSLNLAGGTNYVTGILPVANQQLQTLGGDLSGTTAVGTVSKIQGVVISGTPASGFILEATSSTAASWQSPSGTITLSGDVTGLANANTVGKIQGNTVSSGVLTKGQFFVATSTSNWAATTLSGDISESAGTAGLLTTTGIQNVPVATTSPVQSAVPVYDTAVTKYDIRQLTSDDIGPGFVITSFTGGSTVEVGATVTNPAFSASYSTPAASANITNTDNIDSPLVLTTPFTSGTVVGSFTHNTITSVTFTLTASAAVTKTANQSITYLARTFSGIGTTGATSATASGNNATLVGATGTLTGTSPDGGLFSSIVGQVFGPFNPVSQKIYILTNHTGSAHTFKDQNGFTFAMNTPTTFSFTNQNGVSISMDLYESTNSLSTTFSITVVS